MGIKNMVVAMTGYPEVKINEAGFEFTPAYAYYDKYKPECRREE